ncbi:hypothetical protein D3C72_1922600 [compost metagenome]
MDTLEMRYAATDFLDLCLDRGVAIADDIHIEAEAGLRRGKAHGNGLQAAMLGINRSNDVDYLHISLFPRYRASSARQRPADPDRCGPDRAARSRSP